MHPKRLRSTFLLLTMSLIVLANPQSVRFKNLTVKDGLSSNWVKCFLEDSHGFLWIGTNDGLNKYNGYQFESYKYNDDTIASLNDNNINVIFEDSENNLWIGTHSGINIYDRNKDSFTSVPDIWNYVSDIFELPNKELLIGSPGGLYLLNPQSLSAFQINQHLNIDKILSDSLGNIYMAGKNGVYFFKKEEIPNSFFRMPDASDTFFPDCDIKSMYIDRHDQIWMGTVSSGLTLLVPDYENGEFVQKRYQHQPSNPASIKKGAVLAISEGPEGAIWLGIENNGLETFTPPSRNTSQISFNHYQHSPVDEYSLSFNSVHALYHDRKGTIWVGLYSKGIDYFNNNLFRFNHYYSIPGNDNTLTSNSVNTFLDIGNEILIGTERG
jgi:ligand-binding sensor domain-containing protein